MHGERSDDVDDDGGDGDDMHKALLTKLIM